MDLKFEKAVEEDIPELTGIMKRAFDDDARLHLGIPEGGPPGYDNGEFLRAALLTREEHFTRHGYKIVKGGKTIGFFLLWIYGRDKIRLNRLANIFVDPDYQNKGVGSQAMRFIFDSYPDVPGWFLDTPSWATRNHHFYGKHGFVKKGEEPWGNDPDACLFMFVKSGKDLDYRDQW